MSRDRATKTADEYRAMAQGSYRSAEESFERCDTDGFLSQWASGTMAQKYETLARLAENEGRAFFRVYLDETGAPVPARTIQTKYGSRVAVFASWEACLSRGGRVESWLSRKKAEAAYAVGYFEAEAAVELVGSSTSVSSVVLPFRGLDLGLGAMYSPGNALVVADPRGEVAR